MCSTETEHSSQNIVREESENMASHYINPAEIWDMFYDIYDGNEYACAGAMGNMQYESGLYSDNAENSWNSLTGKTDEWLTQEINNGNISLQDFLRRDWWVNRYGFGYGLSQWTDSSRRTKLWEFTIDRGLDIDSKQGQFDYICWEWTNTDSPYYNLLDDMKAMTSYEQAARFYCNRYEVGSWNYLRKDYAEHWYDTFAGQSGGQYHIYCSSTGNGTCYAIPNTHDALIGETFTIYCDPALGESFVSVSAHDRQGYSVAIDNIPMQTYNAENFPYDIWVEAVFTGVTPPPPPPPPHYDELLAQHRMKIWEYPMFKV